MHAIASPVIVFLGLLIGVLVGLMGIAGGVVAVPALSLLLTMNQHLAQGTSLFLLLPPIGIGALWVYWKNDQVDLAAGSVCALGILLGGYVGGRIAIGIRANTLRVLFGVFLMFTACVLWQRSREELLPQEKPRE